MIAVVDASGSPSVLTDEIAFRRMERNAVAPTTTSSLIAELEGNWTTEEGGQLAQIVVEEVLGKPQ